jgi:hypothetical protein
MAGPAPALLFVESRPARRLFNCALRPLAAQGFIRGWR